MKKYKTEILLHLLAAILFYYLLDPVLKWTGSLLLDSSMGYFTSIIDKKFLKAATLEITEYSYVLLLGVFAVLGVLWLGLIEHSYTRMFVVPKEEPPVKAAYIPTRRDKITAAISMVIGTLFLAHVFLTLAAENIYLEAVTSFRQHMRVIAPYLSPKEEQEILSKWSLMTNERDHRELYKRIKQIAKEHDITLPRTRLY